MGRAKRLFPLSACLAFHETALTFIIIVLKNNQHDVTCGLSFIFMGSRHS